MRLSAFKTSAFYDSLLTTQVDIFLDGQELGDVLEAYEEAGMVRVLVRDEGGHCILDSEKEAVKTTQRYGKVEIRLKENVPALVRRHYEERRAKE